MKINNKKIMWVKTVQTSYNKRYMLTALFGRFELHNNAVGLSALCAFLFRHIFAVAGTLRVPLSQPQNVVYLERYMPFLKGLHKNIIFVIIIILRYT